MSSLTSNLYEFDQFRLDLQNRVLRRAGTVVPLTPKALDVLLFLIQNAGRIVTKDELMKTVWRDSFVEESNLTQTIFMVRKALEETAERRYILTVQGQGYRFLVPVKEASVEPKQVEAPAPTQTYGADVSEVPPQSPPQRTNKLRLAFISSALVAVVLILASGIWFMRRGTVEQPGKIMLAVLPFENFTGDSGQEYLSDGLTEEMISQLGDLDPAHMGVIARTSVMHYKHSQESIPEIGKDLGVQYVVEGSVRRDSQRVRITAQLIEVKDQSHLWAHEYDRDLGHLLELQAEIARDVANKIEASLSVRHPMASEAKATAAGTTAPGGTSYEAYDNYLQGRYFWNKRTAEGFQQAANFFQQAINKDPNFGRAYAGLADTFGLMSTWYVGPQNELMPKARAAALRALELDSNLAEAHASLALIKENYDYDWPGAEQEFQRAIQLNPQYATAHQWYAEFLSWQGRFDQALAESELARQLDPLSLIIATDHASILYFSRQYDGAVKQSQLVAELDPNFEHARNAMIPSYLQMSRYDEAMDEIKQWEAHNQGRWMLAWKTAVYGRSGHSEEARRALAELEQGSRSPTDRTPTLLIAYSGIGQKDRVIELLQKAISEHSNAVMPIKVDPMYDPIRSDPRFEDLLRRIGLQH